LNQQGQYCLFLQDSPYCETSRQIGKLPEDGETKRHKTTVVTRTKAAVSKSRTGQRKTSKKDVRYRMAKEDRLEWLRNDVQELKEEAAALADRAKKTARHAEVLAERIKHLETQIAKTS
jgi:hypothetical protein